jgi:hypothetical protein
MISPGLLFIVVILALITMSVLLGALGGRKK